MTSPITDEQPSECPFCGGPPLTWRAFSASQKASCRDMTCAGYRVVATVGEWNRRAPSAELLAAREALKPFAEVADGQEAQHMFAAEVGGYVPLDDDFPIDGVPLKHFYAARRALSGNRSGKC